MRKFASAGLACALIVVLALPSAASAGVKRDSYGCGYWIGSSFYGAGTVKILKGLRYRVNSGKKGTFAYKPAKRRMVFKTGDYKGFFAIYEPKETLFTVYEKAKPDDELWTCDT